MKKWWRHTETFQVHDVSGERWVIVRLVLVRSSSPEWAPRGRPREANRTHPMLTRIRLPLKLPCHMYNLWLVPCSFLIDWKMSSIMLCSIQMYYDTWASVVCQSLDLRSPYTAAVRIANWLITYACPEYGRRRKRGSTSLLLSRLYDRRIIIWYRVELLVWCL